MAKRLQRTIARPQARERAPEAPRRRRARGGKRVSPALVTDFTLQLATLAEAGIPLVRALSILEGQMAPGPFKAVLGELVDDVSSGTPLSEAMGKHERVFDDLYASMVRAGETGGVLDTILTRLAEFREKAAEIRSKISGAMIYPAVILVVALLVATVVITFVIPKFMEIFDSFGVELPRVTQILLTASDIGVRYWYIVFGLPVVLLILHVLLMRRGGGYRFFMHGRLLKLPILGRLYQLGQISSFARTFGTLIQAGVPHLEALGIVRDTTSNDVLLEAVEDVRQTVREGEGIATPMAESGVFDDVVTNMVEVGEQTGELDRMLLRVATAYEAQLDRRMTAAFKILEPLLLIMMAVFVGFIVVALFLPLMKIMSSLGQA